MTMTAQDCWDAYRGEGRQTNHDGSFELPESVDDLGEAPKRRWDQVARVVNEHVGEAVKEAVGNAA